MVVRRGEVLIWYRRRRVSGPRSVSEVNDHFGALPSSKLLDSRCVGRFRTGSLGRVQVQRGSNELEAGTILIAGACRDRRLL